jgi:nucleoside-diphosphate-sugar epimerase
MNRERHLVTGATGFVGGALVLELLDRTDADLVCLVRPAADAATATKRLKDTLAKAMRAYGRTDLVEQATRRVRALAGDVTLDSCGVDAAAVGDVHEIWHAAASLEFEDRNEREIYSNNVGGTQAVLDLARELEPRTLNYVSTAYVAGLRSGVCAEVLPPLHSAVHNAYERSKIHAEHLVTDTTAFRVRILRPSIVIGHSGTYAATSFTGMYGFIRGMLKIKRVVTRQLGGYLRYRPLRVLADSSAELNLIPVDAVARNAVSLSGRDAAPGIYNLTNSWGARVGDGVDILCDEIGLHRPRYVINEREYTTLDAELNKRITFYAPYMRDRKEFDHSNVDAVLGPEASTWAMSREQLRSYVRWYLDLLVHQSPNLMPWARRAA